MAGMLFWQKSEVKVVDKEMRKKDDGNEIQSTHTASVSVTMWWNGALGNWGSSLLPSIPTLIPRQHNHMMMHVKPLHCTPIPQQQQQEVGKVDIGEGSIMCEPCNGKGWLVCDFCKGQKTNVKAPDNKRIYRRCPSCRAVGYVLCSNCKVFKCVTFPNSNDTLKS